MSSTSALPPGCERLGEACRYPDAPDGARLSAGPRFASVTPLGGRRVRVSAEPGLDAEPIGVGFVVRVAQRGSDAVLLEGRIGRTRGSVELALPQGDDLVVWVQELNAAGLSTGLAQQVTET